MKTLNFPSNFGKIKLPIFIKNNTESIAIFLVFIAALVALIAANSGAFESPNERVTGAIAKSHIPEMMRAAGIVELEGGSRRDTQRLLARTKDGSQWDWYGRTDDDLYKLVFENDQVLYYGREPGDLESKDEFLNPIIKDLQIAKYRLDRYRLKEAEASATWR